MILDTLIYDGKVEQSLVAGGDAGQTKLYRAVNLLIQTSGLMRMPCGSCPVSCTCYNFKKIYLRLKKHTHTHSYTNMHIHEPNKHT